MRRTNWPVLHSWEMTDEKRCFDVRMTYASAGLDFLWQNKMFNHTSTHGMAYRKQYNNTCNLKTLVLWPKHFFCQVQNTRHKHSHFYLSITCLKKTLCTITDLIDPGGHCILSVIRCFHLRVAGWILANAGHHLLHAHSLHCVCHHQSVNHCQMGALKGKTVTRLKAEN